MIPAQVDFVVCTRNNRTIVGDALRAIARQGLECFTCTVVDGCSSDGTPEYIRAEFPFAHVIVKDRDSGPAASRNIGIAQGQSEWIVLVDSDVRLAPEWTASQLRFMSACSVDIACGKLVYASRPELLNAAFGAMNRFGVAWDAGVGDPAARYDHPRPCLWASTSAVAIRRSAVASIGGFDEAMFAAHEDCDFGWRANLLGYRVVFNPDAVAMHNVHGTFRGNVRMAHLLYRNRLRSALVNYEAVHVAQYVGAYLLMAVADIVVRGPRMAKISALAWNARNLRDTLRRRAEVQSKRIVRDRDLWSLFETGVRGPGYAGY